LERAGVLQEAADSDSLECLPIANQAEGRIVIPKHFAYEELSLTELKTAIACHAVTRYKRAPFRFTLKRAELAKKAGIAEWRIGAALKELESRHFLSTRKVWKVGTEIALKEPQSDTELYWLGYYQQQYVDTLPVFRRYSYLLKNYDPKGKLEQITGDVRAYRVFCPFCKCRTDREPTFVFTCVDGEDHWKCHNCRRSGDSFRLWAKLSSWPQTTDWRAILADTCGESALPATFTVPLEAYTEGRIQLEDISK
jgi:hypothetical protein